MTTKVHRPSSLQWSLLVLVAVAWLAPVTGHAQYFGRNKVPYERFKFDVLRTPHWDVHYYDEEATAARDAARMLERWNSRLSSVLAHELTGRKPVILYADHPDFQQTNVISGTLNEGTGGVTESLLDRMQGDRAFATRAGREDLLQAFALLPADDARVPAWRRRLAALLN